MLKTTTEQPPMLKTADLWQWFRDETFHFQLAYTFIHAVPKNSRLFLKFKVADKLARDAERVFKNVFFPQLIVISFTP